MADKKYRAIVSYIEYTMYDFEARDEDEATAIIDILMEAEQLDSPEVEEVFEYIGDNEPEGWDADALDPSVREEILKK
jgi:hypothetical protein